MIEIGGMISPIFRKMEMHSENITWTDQELINKGMKTEKKCETVPACK